MVAGPSDRVDAPKAEEECHEWPSRLRRAAMSLPAHTSAPTAGTNSTSTRRGTFPLAPRAATPSGRRVRAATASTTRTQIGNRTSNRRTGNGEGSRFQRQERQAVRRPAQEGDEQVAGGRDL